MIYEYVTDAPLAREAIFTIPRLGGSVQIAVLCAVLALLVLHLLRPALRLHRPAILIALAASILVNFFFSFGIVDEVSVNLKHPYNLLHFGYYSMAPNEMRDGTVELLYYLLHTPFSQTVGSLIIANGLISFFFAALVLSMPLVLPIPAAFETRAFAALIAANLPTVFYPLASGFGNGLLAAVFSLGAFGLIWRRDAFLLIACFALPLVRPDGLVWAGCLAAAALPSILWSDTFAARRLRTFAMLALAPVAGLCIYLVVYRLLYGYFSPTPILFKSTMPASLLAFSNPVQVALQAIGNVFQPDFSVFIAAVLVVLALTWRSFRATPETASVVLLTVLSAGVLCAYAISTKSTGSFGGDAHNRYALPFFALLPLLLVWIFEKLADGEGKFSRRAAIGGLPAICALVIVASLYPAQDTPVNRWLQNRELNYRAGAVAEELVEKTNIRIATTEMATFALALTRRVEDYWGYTNRRIAQSHLCNAEHVKIDPSAFLETQPEMFWPYWLTDTGGEVAYDVFEHRLGTSHHVNRGGNRLGDMEQVLGAYDAIILTYPDWSYLFLVNRKTLPVLETRLKDKGFTLRRSRSYDLARFRSSYSAEPGFSYKC